MTNTTCIVCQTNPVNSQIGKSFCSRLCEELWMRSDLQFTTSERMKVLALKKHEEFNRYVAELTKNHVHMSVNSGQSGKCYCSICQDVDTDIE